MMIAWIDGFPPKPYSSEWFIAETTYGDRVVLRALPDEYSHDFTTADHTYLMADLVARWMQFPDSEYKTFVEDERPFPSDPQTLEIEENRSILKSIVAPSPCGECHLQIGETCDICGAKQI